MSEIRSTLERFIVTEVGSHRGVQSIAPDDDLISAGIIDSLGIQQVVLFLENHYGITVDDEDVVPDNFESLNRVEAFVNTQLAESEAGGRRRRRGVWG